MPVPNQVAIAAALRQIAELEQRVVYLEAIHNAEMRAALADAKAQRCQTAKVE